MADIFTSPPPRGLAGERKGAPPLTPDQKWLADGRKRTAPEPPIGSRWACACGERVLVHVEFCPRCAARRGTK